MDASNVSNGSTVAGLKLIADLWEAIGNRTNFNKAIKKEPYSSYMKPSAQTDHDLMILAVHRLQFLEMVVKGLNYMECKDAADYSKFIDSKRKLEDMDIDELRAILR